jgi:hypothetical protein
MAGISELWRARLLLAGVCLLSLVPFFLQRLLHQAHIYDIRFAGGLHPSDLLTLRWVGQLSAYLPFIAAGALAISSFRPGLTRPLLTLCVALFLVFLLLFLYQAVMVIILNVPG